MFHTTIPAGTRAVVGFAFVWIRENVIGGYYQAVPLHLHSTRETVDVGMGLCMATAVRMI